MEFQDKIKDIRQAKENEKLVIFVGAGVSKNSNIPTWGELIKVFADELKYNNCTVCSFKNDNVCKDNCLRKYDFSQDEFLKIPQYYYDKDKSDKHFDYYNIIRKTLDIDTESNKIDEIIMELLPDQIITTNYDSLLEEAKSPNTRLYNVVYKDEDLLKQSNKHYIIKMHGDIHDLHSIVLKENDYISYSQTHILIETKIKSLLIDHTFLFVGYSLNDYNLKLILGWINYLAKENKVQERPKNYIIQVDDKATEDYIKLYLEANNVYILNTNDLPKKIKDKNNHIKLSSFGREVYSCLDYILDSENDFLAEPLVDILLDKFKIFKDFKRISYQDLIEAYSFKGTKLNGYMMEFHDKNEYEKIKKIILCETDKAIELGKIFTKAGIKYIYCIINHKVEETEIMDSPESNDEELFSFYLDYKYDDILNKINKIDDNELKIYYSYLINYNEITNTEDYMHLLNKVKDKLLKNKSTYKLLIYEYNEIAFKKLKYLEVDDDYKKVETIINQLPEKNKKAYGFMKEILFGGEKNLLRQKNLFEKCENTYVKNRNSTYWGLPLVNLLEIQGMAYDYYFYFKLNNLTLDYFSNTRNYFKYYLKTILCTYWPEKNNKSDTWFGKGTELQEYEINRYDLDMFIRYTAPKELLEWIDKYKVKEIKLSNDLNNKVIITKFENLCGCIVSYYNRFMYDYLYSFSIIICKLNFNREEKTDIVKELLKLINVCKGEYNGLIVNILEPVYIICKEFIGENIEEFVQLLSNLIDYNVIKEAENRGTINQLCKIYDLLSKYKTDCIYIAIEDILKNEMIDTKEKLNCMFMLRKNLNDKQIKKYVQLLNSSKLENINYENVFWLVYDNIIEMNEYIIDKYINIIESEIINRNGAIRTIPDHLQTSIELLIILHLLGKLKDISFLEKYKEYSVFLKFIFEPDTFDYSGVDINNYMWVNFFKNKEYLDIILNHKNDIPIDKIKTAIINGSATEKEKKIMYRYLLTEEDFWNLNN